MSKDNKKSAYQSLDLEEKDDKIGHYLLAEAEGNCIASTATLDWLSRDMSK